MCQSWWKSGQQRVQLRRQTVTTTLGLVGLPYVPNLFRAGKSGKVATRLIGIVAYISICRSVKSLLAVQQQVSHGTLSSAFQCLNRDILHNRYFGIIEFWKHASAPDLHLDQLDLLNQAFSLPSQGA